MKLILNLICLFFFQNTYVQSMDADSMSDPRYKHVLSVDGGGVRGIYAAKVLSILHNDLKNVNKYKKGIHEFFQGGMSGTSTGSLIVLALATKEHRKIPNRHNQPVTSCCMNRDGLTPENNDFIDGPYSLDDIMQFYETMSTEVFQCWNYHNCIENWRDCHGSYVNQCLGIMKNIVTCGGCCACCYNCNGYCGPQYSNHKLKRLLQHYFGDLTLGQTYVPVQIVAYDFDAGRPTYFTSTINPNMKMVDAALASAAAPTYFEAYLANDGNNILSNYIDGGVFENSSSLSAIRFAMENYINKRKKTIRLAKSKEINCLNKLYKEKWEISQDDITLVSIGTGAPLKESNRTYMYRGNKLKWAKEIVDISITSSSIAINNNIEEIEKLTSKKAGRYYRFNCTLTDSECPMDDPNIIHIIKRKATTNSFGFKNNPAYLQFKSDFCEMNINNDFPLALFDVDNNDEEKGT